mmetsp:Transcript_109388/g.172425  ORF Transcript_109388/g.172425 Transcript_109388/m.172425 type:complete len:203 (-) Transcript_109388:533-1141(-)
MSGCSGGNLARIHVDVGQQNRALLLQACSHRAGNLTNLLQLTVKAVKSSACSFQILSQRVDLELQFLCCVAAFVHNLLDLRQLIARPLRKPHCLLEPLVGYLTCVANLSDEGFNVTNSFFDRRLAFLQHQEILRCLFALRQILLHSFRSHGEPTFDDVRHRVSLLDFAKQGLNVEVRLPQRIPVLLLSLGYQSLLHLRMLHG